MVPLCSIARVDSGSFSVVPGTLPLTLNVIQLQPLAEFLHKTCVRRHTVLVCDMHHI